MSYFNDPGLSKSQLLANLLAAKYARMNNPTGVISDRDLKDAKSGLGLESFLTHYKDVTAKLDELEAASGRTRAIATKRLPEKDRSGVGPYPNAEKERLYQEWKAQQPQ